MAYASGRAFSELGRGLSGLGATLMELRQRKAEDAREREREAFRDALLLAGQGGGIGPVPTVEGTVRGSRAPLAFEAPSFLPEPSIEASPLAMGSGGGLRASSLIPDVPTFGSPEGVGYSMPDPNMVSVGPGYIERPGVAEARSRARVESGLGNVYGPDVSPEMIGGMADLYQEGITPPRPGGEPDDVNWQTVTDAQGNMWQVHPRTGEKRELGLTGHVPGSGSDRPIGVPTYNQAIEQLRGIYGMWGEAEPGAIERPFLGYRISDAELHKRATAMARGEDPGLPTSASYQPPPPVAPEPTFEAKPGFLGFLERALPGGSTGLIETPPSGNTAMSERQVAWDRAAEALRARNQNPDAVLGPRPLG